MTIPRKIEVSHRTIIFTVLFLLFLWFLYLVRDIILQVFVALLIMAVLNPPVTKLSKYKIPRALSIIVVYILFFGIIGFAISSVVPPLAEQTGSFVNKLPVYLGSLGFSNLVSDEIIKEFITSVSSLPSQFAKFTVSVLSNIISVLTVLTLAFYMLLARDKLDKQLGLFLGEKKSKKAESTIDLLEKRLGGWARGQFSLMLLVGASTYLGLGVLGIPFALPLSILAGLLEIVPYIGPILAAVPPVLIGLGISPVIGIATAALAFLIQQLEGYVFIPKVMQKSVGVSPLTTLLSLAIGFRVAGAIGILISVPVVITSQVLLKDYFSSK